MDYYYCLVTLLLLTMNNMPHPKKPIPGEEEHASFILNKLEELYLDEDSPSKDVTLLVEGRKFKAHKWILSMQNFGIFCHFSGDVEFVVKGISSDGFEQVLRYLYTGRISLSVLTDKVFIYNPASNLFRVVFLLLCIFF